MGAAELWERLIDGESGPILDRGLLLSEFGMVDNLRIQEPRDETDSLLISSSTTSDCTGASPCQKKECLLPLPLRGKSLRGFAFEYRWWLEGGRFGVEELRNGGEEGFDSGVICVELVPGRETGEEEPWCMILSAVSPTFLFLEEGRGGDERSGFPKAKPAAAMPTVLEATRLGIVFILGIQQRYAHSENGESPGRPWWVSTNS
jgi:hypothetical protein